MKKLLILLFSISLVFTSCVESLDIVQDGELNDATLFTSVSNMQLFLNAGYARVSTQTDIITSSVLTDEVALGSAGFPNQTHNFNVVSTNGFASGIWNSHYNAINYMNRLIRGAQNVTPAASEVAAYNNVLAQARAIRAFCHFQLLTYFSTDLANNSALGVMKLDFVPTTQQRVSRSTNGEVFQLIEDDLAFAAANMSAANNFQLANRTMVSALRARMYLYRKNYPLAEQYANEVLATPGLTLSNCSFTLPANFPLTASTVVPTGAGTGSSSFDASPTGANSAIQLALFTMDRHNATTTSPAYKKMWVDSAPGECIFSLARLNNAANFGSQYNTNQSYISGGPLWDMGRNLYTLLTQPLGGGAEDFRRWAFVDRSATISATPLTATRLDEVIVIDKYAGKTGGHSSNDIKVFRLSEIYFIKAECRVRANDLAGAAGLLQTVRQARNYIPATTVPTPSYSSGQQAFADIMLERRKELCFEGHRYIDLKRLGADAGITSTDRFQRDSENSSAISPFNINVSDFRFTLPIPQNEINVNPMPQNPGY